MNIELDPEHQKLAEQLVAAGRFTSVKDAVSHALRLLVEEEEHTSELSEEAFIAEVRAGYEEAERGELLPLPSVEEILTEANASLR